jgi:hypothetical protein
MFLCGFDNDIKPFRRTGSPSTIPVDVVLNIQPVVSDISMAPEAFMLA